MRLSTGVMVIYPDDESCTFMTPDGPTLFEPNPRDPAMTAGASPKRGLPPAAVGLIVAVLGAGVLLTVTRFDLSGAVFFVAYAGIGGYLAVHRPANSVGWLLMLTGWGLAMGGGVAVPLDALLAGTLDPGQAFAAWANGWVWSLVFVGVLGIVLVFPSGRLPAGRGRWPARIALAVEIGLAILLAIGPTISVAVTDTAPMVLAPNPAGVLRGAAFWAVIPNANELYVAMFFILIGGLIWLGLRYRESVGLERLQYRWLVAAVALVAVATLVWATNISPLLGGVAVLLSYPAVPIAIAVAVLRYRLYEIDRIISRTIAYAAITAIVASVFGVGIVLLTTVLAAFAAGQTLAVAGATLIAYAVAQPVHRRVRRAVDRRFDRARYDHERTVSEFSAWLRNEIDVDAVTNELATTTRAAVAPASVSLWLRPVDIRR